MKRSARNCGVQRRRSAECHVISIIIHYHTPRIPLRCCRSIERLPHSSPSLWNDVRSVRGKAASGPSCIEEAANAFECRGLDSLCREWRVSGAVKCNSILLVLLNRNLDGHSNTGIVHTSNMSSPTSSSDKSGRCLCGRIEYELKGPSATPLYNTGSNISTRIAS